MVGGTLPSRPPPPGPPCVQAFPQGWDPQDRDAELVSSSVTDADALKLADLISWAGSRFLAVPLDGNKAGVPAAGSGAVANGAQRREVRGLTTASPWSHRSWSLSYLYTSCDLK